MILWEDYPQFLYFFGKMITNHYASTYVLVLQVKHDQPQWFMTTEIINCDPREGTGGDHKYR